MPHSTPIALPTILTTTNNMVFNDESINFSTSTTTTTIGVDLATEQSEDAGGNEYVYILPAIVLFGLCGNTISLVTIINSRLRKTVANQYLIVLTLADSVFLLGITFILFKVDFANYFACVCIEYVLMSASYVSAWSIAGLTLERYLAIAHPLKHVQYGHVNRLWLMLIWVPIPFVLNIIQFVVLEPGESLDDRPCRVTRGQLQLTVETLDVILCYLLPCLIVVAMNVLIASKITAASRTFHSMANTSTTSGYGGTVQQQQPQNHKLSMSTTYATYNQNNNSNSKMTKREKNKNAERFWTSCCFCCCDSAKEDMVVIDGKQQQLRGSSSYSHCSSFEAESHYQRRHHQQQKQPLLLTTSKSASAAAGTTNNGFGNGDINCNKTLIKVTDSIPTIDASARSEAEEPMSVRNAYLDTTLVSPPSMTMALNHHKIAPPPPPHHKRSTTSDSMVVFAEPLTTTTTCGGGTPPSPPPKNNFPAIRNKSNPLVPPPSSHLPPSIMKKNPSNASITAEPVLLQKVSSSVSLVRRSPSPTGPASRKCYKHAASCKVAGGTKGQQNPLVKRNSTFSSNSHHHDKINNNSDYHAHTFMHSVKAVSGRTSGGCRSSSSSESTHILIVVPVVYMLLNTPFYIFRMLDTISLNVFNSPAFSAHQDGGLSVPFVLFLHNAAHYLYYFNFASDVVVYAFSSVNFRRAVIAVWRRLLCPKSCNQPTGDVIASQNLLGGGEARTGYAAGHNVPRLQSSSSVARFAQEK